MKFGIYCNNFTDQNMEIARTLMVIFDQRSYSFTLFEDLKNALSISTGNTFNIDENVKLDVDILITIGGDGTILNTMPLIVGSNIPILGINTGRLGFLTSITVAEIDEILDEIAANVHQVETRSLLQMNSSRNIGDRFNIALNEISVLKKDSSSMITIHAELDGSFLNTYWADGLIISTPTGSTAYSLSCGGPLVSPGSGNFIVTPIAPHNLNVRPLVVPDTSEIKLKFETRSSDLLVALDSNTEIIPDDIEITIKKAVHRIGLLRMKKYSYLETLRHKMNWGLDLRN